MVWASGGALARVWGRFAAWAAPEHYKYSGLADLMVHWPTMGATKLQMYDFKFKMHGKRESTIKLHEKCTMCVLPATPSEPCQGHPGPL